MLDAGVVHRFLRPCAMAALVAVLVAFLAACAGSSTVEQVTNPDQLKPLAFLDTGAVSRKDIEHRLGVPWSVYEDGRIVIYHFDWVGPTAPLRRAEWSGNFHLVIVYTKDDKVERWSLVNTDRRQ